jgi:hypothetical protein
MATSQSKGRTGNVGSGSNNRVGGNGVDDDANSVAQWAIAGMVFFGIICFICLPVAAMILIEAKKINANAQSALVETKKLQQQLKPKKEVTDE